MPEGSSRDSKNVLLMTVVLLIILIPFGYSVVSSLFAQEAQFSNVELEKPDPKHTNCVEDTTYMRYHHWELLIRVLTSQTTAV